ncbi:MAG TPA: serine/threonine-protein kinase [Thermoanaerobaculia bacterium]|nr:serine/threonine-protein kinase [Thermoanaerobaculia bacterium]
MDLQRWHRIDEIVQQALDLDPAAWPELLRASCGSDDALRRDVLSLLRNHSHGLLGDRTAVEWVAAEMSGDPPRLAAGQLLGRYRIRRRIGAGGMGEVYEAWDDVLQRRVAIKVLATELVDAARAIRLQQEALAASGLSHANIVTIYELGQLDGVPFLVEELVEGETLRSLLKRRLELPHAVRIAAKVARALEAAHAANVVHRDIKPENIMIRAADGEVKVLDFGIAQVGGGRELLPAPAAGTPAYMSPEQMRGETPDQRTDLFSLGVVLYELVSGERPFTGPTRAETSTVHLDQILPATNRLGDLPKELQRIIRKMLEPLPDARYASAPELLHDLDALQRDLGGRRTRRVLRAFAGLAALLVLGLAISAWRSYAEIWQERVLRDGHTAAVRRALFSPDGRFVVSCSEDGQTIVWDFARRQRWKTLPLHAYKLDFSPDGRWLAAGEAGGAVTILDTATWKPARVFRDHPQEIGAVTFSPDGSLLATSSYADTIVRRTSDWKKLHQWNDGGYGSFVFSRDGGELFFGRGYAVDLRSGRQLPTNSPGAANGLAMLPNGRELAALDAGGNLSFYRIPDSAGLSALQLIARQPGHRDNGRSVAVSPDGKYVATAADDILLWDAATHQKLARFEHPAIVWSVAFSPDGRWLLSGHADGAVLVWDVAERRQAFSFSEHSGGVRAVAMSPDGRMIASGAEDRSVTLWDPARGRRIAVLEGHQSRVMSLGFSRSGGFASLDFDANAIVWDLQKRSPRTRFRWNGPGLALAMSPDGRHVATTRGIYSTAGVMLVDFERTTIPMRHGYHAHPNVYGVSYSADGRLLAAVTEGGLVMVWDARRLRLLELVHVPDTSQIAVSLSPDGRSMITGEDEGAVRLWSTVPLRQKAILGRHTARVKSVAFSPTGKTAASAGDDKTIALWDVQREQLRAHIGTHTSPVYTVAFSPDGRQLLSGGHDRSVRLYTRDRRVWGVSVERWLPD